MIFTKKKMVTIIVVAVLIFVSVSAVYANSSVKLIVNNQEEKPDVSPKIINGRVMVPIMWVAEALGTYVRWDELNKEVNNISNPKPLSSLSEADAKLYPFQQKDGVYYGFILEFKGNRKYFDWINVINPTYRPQLLYNDVNNDGKKELIIILTTGYGTGVHIEKIHIINPNTLTEFDIETPDDIIKNNVKTKITSDENNVNIQITIGSKETTIIKKKSDAIYWFDNVAFRNSYHYEVISNKLMIRILAQVSPGGSIGEIQATYVFDNGKYIAKTINFIKD